MDEKEYIIDMFASVADEILSPLTHSERLWVSGAELSVDEVEASLKRVERLLLEAEVVINWGDGSSDIVLHRAG